MSKFARNKGSSTCDAPAEKGVTVLSRGRRYGGTLGGLGEDAALLRALVSMACVLPRLRALLEVGDRAGCALYAAEGQGAFECE